MKNKKRTSKTASLRHGVSPRLSSHSVSQAFRAGAAPILGSLYEIDCISCDLAPVHRGRRPKPIGRVRIETSVDRLTGLIASVRLLPIVSRQAKEAA